MSQSTIPAKLKDVKRQLRDPKKKLDPNAQQLVNSILIKITNEINRQARKLFKEYRAINCMKAVQNPGLELMLVYHLSRPHIGNVSPVEPAAFLIEIIENNDFIKQLQYKLHSNIISLPGYVQLTLLFVDDKR
ncbi:hypothetical protein SAMN05428988_3184 [Chitinophaga sp. YR573]|uniref:hypothetical protein n=1 Tax=Chitinophaga sp. YR573 TaxID=1881040 RepID=UPI0008C3EA94|nr:hypothetical protein [Chitinophaga sp. YR573]SEW21203.1 hypothetical protein SAMN05428988_3184 [Chitinophaga sp. YR573]